MNQEQEYQEQLQQILEVDERYHPDAYEFVHEAIAYTGKKLKTQQNANNRHISGQQLLGGIRELALQKFGPLTLELLHFWGVHTTDDFGNIVFNLVRYEMLGVSEQDSPTDFHNIYSFDAAFNKPFQVNKSLPEKIETIN